MAAETEKRENMKVGFETLRDDMQQLTDDFKEIMHTISEKSKDVIVEGGQKAGSTLKSLSESAKGRASDVYSRMSERSKDTVEKSRQSIAVRPITYLFAALAAGVALGAILRSIK